MVHAILALALMSLSPQEKAPAKTVEERLKELEERLGTLEKRHKTLEEENQALEKKIGDAKAARETYAKQSAGGWVKRYSKPAEFSEKQSSELEELWFGWIKSDFEKPADAVAWKSREETLKGKLSTEQVPKLARAVHDEQERAVKMSVTGLVQTAKISADHAAALEKAVLAKISIPEDTIIPQAHPEKQVAWFGIYGAAEQVLPDLVSVLSEEEMSRLRDFLAKFKPRR